MIDLSAISKKVNARVKEYLEKPCFGCMNPVSKNRKWEATTIRGALSHKVSSQAALEKLAKLAETAEISAGESTEIYEAARAVYKAAKTKQAQGRDGGLWAFQFTHSAKKAENKEVENETPTGVYFADVDHIKPEMMDKARAALLAMPAAFAVGESVSRRGFGVAMAYHTDGLTLKSADVLRVFECVSAAVDATLKAAGIAAESDKDAKNPVRWRYGLLNVSFKDDSEIITPLSIAPASVQKEKPESSDSAPEMTDSAKLEKKARAAIFSMFDAGIDDDFCALYMRTLYEKERPTSSRLKDGEIERFVKDARKYWQENGGGKKSKKASEREKMAAYLDGWKFDTFHGHILTPNGEALEIDHAASRIARDLLLSKNMAADGLAVYVQDNPARCFDGLRERALELASAYTEANDYFSIQSFTAQAQFDTYEARRFQLWMYQLMARAFCPGEKCDGLLLLTGAEGLKKSMLFDEISMQFIGRKAKIYKPTDGKDCDIAMSQNAIMLIEEFDKYQRKRDVAEIKEQITAASSKRRAAYAHGEKERLNRAVWAGTTNDPRPIPSGEGEARRYWLVKVRNSLSNVLTGDLICSMLREAAYDVKRGLDSREGRSNGDEYGKVWVPTAEEIAETAARNAGAKSYDAEALAITVMLDALRRAPNARREVLTPAQWGYVAEIGDAFQYINGVSAWKPPKCNAAAAARLIRERCRAADCTRKKGRADEDGHRQNGYALSDLCAAFAVEESAADDSEAPLAFV